jgi:YggT family protein
MELLVIVQTIFQIYTFILLARVLISWVQLDPYNPIVQFLYSVTEPVLAPIRRMMPQTGMMDLSPLIAFIALQVLERIVLIFLASMLQ